MISWFLLLLLVSFNDAILVEVFPVIVLRSSLDQDDISDGQLVAQSRANYMARHNHRGHPPRRRTNPPDFTKVGSFEGVGWTSRKKADQQSIRTCRPSGRGGAQDDRSRTLVGDAVAHGAGGSYRVRIWGKR